MVKAASPSEKSLSIYYIARFDDKTEDCHIRTRCCENLKSYHEATINMQFAHNQFRLILTL
jgi:hypothetical protein